MKFCTKCGNELLDYAVVCTKCGCMVESAPQATPNTQSTPFQPTANHSSLLPEIFNFIFDLFAILSGLMFGWALSETWISTNAYFSQYTSSVSAYSYLFYDGIYHIFALIAAITATILAITSLIVTLVKHCENKYVFASVKRIVLGAALILLSLLFLVF